MAVRSRLFMHTDAYHTPRAASSALRKLDRVQLKLAEKSILNVS